MWFARSARFYDAVYAARGKDYAAEAGRLRRWLSGPEPGRRLRLLDVGCGTGEHLKQLAGTRALLVGLDLDAAMLSVARAKLPGALLVQGDMRRPPLAGGFDGILCLFASLGYLADAGAAREAVVALARLLRSGGVLLLEPPLGPDRLQPAQRSRMTLDVEGARVTRITDARHEPDRLRVRFEYHVEGSTDAVAFEEEHRILALSLAQCVGFLESAGLTVARDDAWPSGPGLLIGTRP